MKKGAPTKRSGKRRFAEGSTLEAMRDIAPSFGGGRRFNTPTVVDSEEPSGRSLARRGRSDVSRQGRPSIDVDLRRTRIGQEKFVGSGSGEDVKRPALSPPKTPPPSSPRAGSGPGMLARGLTGLGLMAYSPAVGEGSDKPKNYPGEGLKAKEQPTPAKPASATPAPTSSGDYSSEMKRYREAAPSLAKSSAASTPAKSEARAKPTAKSSMATSTKPIRRPMNSQRKSAGDDSFLADLRASAAKMKSATSEMSEKTGKLKDKAGAFSSSFKKGGAIKSRGDGIARRGLTKGRMR